MRIEPRFDELPAPAESPSSDAAWLHWLGIAVGSAIVLGAGLFATWMMVSQALGVMKSHSVAAGLLFVVRGGSVIVLLAYGLSMSLKSDVVRASRYAVAAVAVSSLFF